jgi:hypothetical protein
MVSLEAKLAAIVEAMNSSEKKLFAQKSKDMRGNVEATLNVAESILGADLAEARRTENIRESSGRGSIRRNNGASGFVSESEAKMGELKESQTKAFMAMGHDEKLAKSMAGIDDLSVQGERLSESQRDDFNFCVLCGMSEADAMKVALSPGGTRSF